MDSLQPILRFPSFIENWKVKRLEELGEFIGGGTPNTSVEDFWNGDIPWISSSDIIEDEIQNIKISRFLTKRAIKESATKIIPKNSILLVSRVGVGKLAVNNVEVCTSQDFTNINIYNDNSYFIGYNLISRKNVLQSFSQGTSIKGFTSSDIKTLQIVIPSLEEQTKIANFLSAVDEKLNLLKEKKSLLEDYKKGIMQKIFNQEIRFKDDNGNNFEDWVEKTLGEISDIITGKTPSTKDDEIWNGDIQFITPTDIKEGEKYQKKTERHVVSNSKLKILPVNSIIYTCIASIGKMCISIKPCITNQQINSLVIHENCNYEYVYYWLFYITPLIKSTQANTTLPIINKTDFSKFKIQIPSLKEQTKIANFLSAIDEKIELVSNQIEDTQEYKKGLLQQMFV